MTQGKEEKPTGLCVGQEAPDFQVTAVKDGQIIENFTLSQYCGHTYVVLFFYPLDFTFVCPTEIWAFQCYYPTFLKLGAEVIGASTDSPYSHLKWWQTPKKEGGIQGVQYPLLADMTHQVAKAYGVLKEDEGIALRGTFIMDKQGIIQVQMVNNLSLGRNVQEVVRLLQALQFTEKHGEVCPATWTEGAPGIEASSEGVRQYFGS